MVNARAQPSEGCLVLLGTDASKWAVRRGAPFPLSLSARNKPYTCQHLQDTLYTLRASPAALLCTCTGGCISRDLQSYLTARDRARYK